MQTENSFHSFRNDYLIKISELQKLLQKAYSSEEKIKLTIERFSIACGRESDYDRLLDLVIALEILLGQGDADSIKYKIIIRLLNLISNNRETREMLHCKMGGLYAARNAIVHQSDIKPAFDCINNLES